MAMDRLVQLGGFVKDISTGVSDIVWSYFSKSEPRELADDEINVLERHLRPLYGDQTWTVVRQAVHILHDRYLGNMERFLAEYFYPAVNLLVKLKKREQQLSEHVSDNDTDPTSEIKADDCWPLVCQSGIVINLRELPSSDFEDGHFYFFLSQSLSAQLGLLVKCVVNGKCRQVCVAESEYGEIFTMEWRDRLMRDSSQDLGKLLHNCIVNLEENIACLQWEDVVCAVDTVGGRRQHHVTSVRPALQHKGAPKTKHKNSNSVSHSQTESGANIHLATSTQGAGDTPNHHGDTRETVKEFCHRDDSRHSRQGQLQPANGTQAMQSEELRGWTMDRTDGRELDKPRSPRNPGLHQHRPLDVPKTILDVDYKLLQSGVAVLPGCHDHDNNAVVLIFTSSSLWKNQQVNSTDLARLIMYYHTVPRETVRCRGLTVVADIRGCTASTINTLLESLYLFEGNVPQAISIVHLVADKHTQSLVLKSPIYDVQASFQIDLLLSSDLLFSYVSVDQLPPVLDGLYQYCHEDWMRFRMRLDPFLSSCRAVAKYLVSVMQELSAVDQAPSSSKEAGHLVQHHENLVQATFEDPRLKRLENEGEAILHSLEAEEANIGNSDDYRYAMEEVQAIYHHVRDTILKLVRLSDSRLLKLEKCLQLKEFEEECSKIISWLHTQGNDCLQRHLAMADNLKGVRAQQKDFEKFYFSAMTHIEKGNDLLEDASMLSQSGNYEDVTGYRELARMLKRHLQQFSEKLEATRERMEGTTQCYHLLDKTYEWALEAMKYVASMKMEHCAKPEGLEKLLRSLDHYLLEHPPIPDNMFSKMFDIAQGLKNDKLLEQCRTAQGRCKETQKMLTLRENTLKQFKEQLENDTTQSLSALSARLKIEPGGMSASQTLQTESAAVVSETCSNRRQERSNNSLSPSHSVISSSSCHTPTSPCHSSSLSSSSPSLSPVHSVSSSDSSHGANYGSHRIVSSTPKPSSHTNTSSPRHTVTDSETSHGAACRLSPTSHDITPASGLPQAPARTRPAKKVLKRAITSPLLPGAGPVIVEEDPASLSEPPSARINSLRQNGRTDSMITGSSESLPSLPEEDEGVVTTSADDQPYPRREWTPVPVNSHLKENSCSAPTQNFADLKLSEAEMKSRRTLSLVMSEMIQTERDYVCSLQFIVENYIPEMGRDDVPQALRGKRNVIFGNLEKIYHFHSQYFVQEMEASRRNPFLIGRYFLMHESQFHLYTLYNKNKPKSDCLMAEYGKHFFREKQLELGDKMDLASYLLKPVQRMGKYALLVKQILKECPRSAPEYQQLKAAENMVRFQLRHGNDLLAMDALKECDVNIQEQGRLLRQEEFLVYQGRRKCMRHVFLFEDLILFSKTRRGRNGSQDTYIYRHSFKMSDIGLTEDFQGSGYKFEIWFRRRMLGENYVLQAPNSDVKKNWIKDIRQLLWDQAVKNRETHLSELATMGIGNKPCMDIKPSADNIQDRFVNIGVGERGARTRNSIAVCSTDFLRQGNKRPHSTISVSSNSSSNSSHSGFGAMNLALNPVDSPRTYRKSLTFMSSESGIGTSIASADMDSTLKYDDNTQMSPYTEFTRPYSVNLSSHPEEVTDV